jgi:hypothetical protein
MRYRSRPLVGRPGWARVARCAATQSPSPIRATAYPPAGRAVEIRERNAFTRSREDHGRWGSGMMASVSRRLRRARRGRQREAAESTAPGDHLHPPYAFTAERLLHAPHCPVRAACAGYPTHGLSHGCVAELSRTRSRRRLRRRWPGVRAGLCRWTARPAHAGPHTAAPQINPAIRYVCSCTGCSYSLVRAGSVGAG